MKKRIAVLMLALALTGCTQPTDETTQPTEDTRQVTTEATAPAETTQPTEAVTTETTLPLPEAITYEAYLALTAEEQEEYSASFPSVDDFFAWLDQAKAEYDATAPTEDNDGFIVEEGVGEWE